MAKPSIFSREYDRKMKARKKRRVVLAFCLAVAAVFFLGRTTYLNWREKNAESLKNKNNKEYLTEKEKEVDNAATSNEIKPEEKPLVVESVLDIKLADDKILKLVYAEEAGIKKIKDVSSEGNFFNVFDISPLKDKVVILTPTQDMYIVDLNGKIIDITMPRYVTQSSKKEILKTEYLQRKPDFIWHGTPRFINDTTIVWTSQVPWFKTTKYIWRTDLTSLKHSRIREFEGEEILLGVIEEKGLSVTINSLTKYLSSDGTIVQ